MSYAGIFTDKNNTDHPITSTLYGTCATAANEAAKVVVCTDFDTLLTGMTIRVKFDNANTAASPTVNINSTGAKSVYRIGSTAPVDGDSWKAGEVVELLYDGTSFFMVSADDIGSKQDALTFDDTPTDGSNNPVKSNGIYDALVTKANTDMVAADFNVGTSYTAGNYCVQDGKLYKFKNNHSGAWSSADVDEVKITGELSVLKSGLTNLDNEVNGDSTTYPYADVITIEDAIPANVADCSVKIEPVQDLHGYDHPWVGGAGKNKENVTLTTGTYSGVTWTVYDDKRIKISGTVPEGGVTLNTAIADVDTTALAGYKFIYSTEGNGDVYARIMNSDLTSNLQDLSNNTVIADNGSNCKLVYRVVNNNNYDVTVSSMIVASTETDLSYAPYTNICPITGHTEASVQRDGKNKYDKNSNDNAYNKGLSQSTGELVNANSWIVSPYIPVNGNQYYTYTDNRVSISWGIVFCYYDSNKTFISSNYLAQMEVRTIQTPANASYVRFELHINAQNYVQFEFGNIATPYVPYAGKTYTIALGDTIYGGTLRIDNNGNTVMDVDKAERVYDGSEDEQWVQYIISGDKPLYRITVSGKANGEAVLTLIDNIFPVVAVSNRANNTLSGSGYYVDIIKEDIATVEAWKTYLASNPLQICYELENPTTIQLTPQQIQLLKGQNTIKASTGDISVTVNGVSGSIGAVQEQVNATDAALAELAEKLPTAPTTDGAYVLTVTVADGTPTYSWESAT